MKKKSWLKKFIEGRKNNTDGYCEYPGVGRIYDIDVAKFTLQHSHWYDWFNPILMICYAQFAYSMKMKIIEEPTDPNWKFPI